MRLQQILIASAAAFMLAMPAAYGQTARIQQSSPKMTSFLGVGLQEINSQRARDMKLPAEAGVEITSVQDGSPAATAGLKVGDVVTQYNGQMVVGVEQFTRLVQETPAGRDVSLQIYRGGTPMTITAKIGSHQAPPPLWSQGQFPFQIQPGLQLPRPELQRPGSSAAGATGELGIQGLELQGQLADYFGVRQGVLVAMVAQGTPAERAGLKAGDVITRVGNTPVATPADITGQIRTARWNSLTLTIMRDHKEMTVTATMGGERF